ncbi:D-sedoheptulose 7-phosphate isomerase [Candidatus Woesearchaeota archaeon]|nr:D-sedoheptulose 7-phosphate isomerase [Candidatus Woesearchaeota archaeon]
MKDTIRSHLEESIRTKQRVIQEILPHIEQAAQACIEAYKRGNKMLIAGNGGSAADAQHVAGELVNYFRFDRDPISCIALTTDTSVVTSISNDTHFRNVFARQLAAHSVKGDVFIAISTSGNSENVLEAIHAAKKRGVTVIGLTGQTGGKMDGLCDIMIKIPSTDTPRIQESHMTILHSICELLEKELFKSASH